MGNEEKWKETYSLFTDFYKPKGLFEEELPDIAELDIPDHLSDSSRKHLLETIVPYRKVKYGVVQASIVINITDDFEKKWLDFDEIKRFQIIKSDTMFEKVKRNCYILVC